MVALKDGGVGRGELGGQGQIVDKSIKQLMNLPTYIFTDLKGKGLKG